MKEVPVNKPVPPCALPSVIEFPQVRVVAKSEDGSLVTIPVSDMQGLAIWIVQENARLEKAEVCLANRS